jgi:seryl-tRNA synthetase
MISPGVHWNDNGYATFTGLALKLYYKLDSLFSGWAEQWNATTYHVPSFISATEMQKIDYFRSFPHLITFPVTLQNEQENLLEFAKQDLDESITLTASVPIRNILTPAACYHFFILLQQQSFDSPQYLTTRGSCFRNETHYSPLERQWNFSMREIVCIGTMQDVNVFLSSMRNTLQNYFSSIALPIEWIEATDPFFNPAANPKYLAQILEPVKTEMLFEKRLAIGSVNLHRNFFGETFRIQCNGREAFSGCLAFGVERWMYAFLSHFGPHEDSWPLQ